MSQKDTVTTPFHFLSFDHVPRITQHLIFSLAFSLVALPSFSRFSPLLLSPLLNPSSDRVTSSCRIYAKDGSDASGWQIDPNSKRPSRNDLRVEFQKLILKEKEVVGELKDREQDADKLIKQLEEEEQNVQLVKSIYDAARDKAVSIQSEYTRFLVGFVSQTSRGVLVHRHLFCCVCVPTFVKHSETHSKNMYTNLPA